MKENAVLKQDVADWKIFNDDRRRDFTKVLRGGSVYSSSESMSWGEIFAEVGSLIGKEMVLKGHSGRLFDMVGPVKSVITSVHSDKDPLAELTELQKS